MGSDEEGSAPGNRAARAPLLSMALLLRGGRSALEPISNATYQFHTKPRSACSFRLTERSPAGSFGPLPSPVDKRRIKKISPSGGQGSGILLKVDYYLLKGEMDNTW